MSEELFNTDETPFNLAGELIDNSMTREGELRLCAQLEAEAKKAQRTFLYVADKGETVIEFPYDPY